MFEDCAFRHIATIEVALCHYALFRSS